MSEITVVVPVYNVESLLKRCVDSILNQTFINIKVILINDGSTDTSGEICNLYRDSDSRVSVIHQTNQGLSVARNNGIINTKSPYIGFIDSDDWIHPDFYSKLYQDIKTYSGDISSCNYQEVFKMKDVKKIPWKNEDTILMNRETALKKLLTSAKEGSHTAWNKLYRTSIFENIKYPKGRLYEDASTTYKLFFNSDKITYNPAPYLYYWQREGSIMSKKFDEKNMDKLKAVDEMYEFFKEKDSLYIEYVDTFKIVSALRMMADILPSGTKEFKEEYKEIESILLNQENYRNPHLHLRHKLLLKTFKLNPKIYSFIWQKRLEKRS